MTQNNKSEKIKKKDFIELDFSGYANSDLFDSTKPEEVKTLNQSIKPEEVKPLKIVVGQGMVVKGFDQALEGKEVGKEYEVKLTPEQSFGERKRDLIKTIPMKIFHEKNVTPQPGMMLQLDQFLVKIISVSGGRVLTDFNNPLSGKEIEYKFKILNKIQDLDEKIKVLINFFFKQELNYDLDKEKKKIIFKDKNFKPLIDMFKPQFKDLLDLDIEVESKTKEKKKE